MADPDSLSPDQLDKVMAFQEVSGCTDVGVCVIALAAAEWEVERAVHEHLTKLSSGEASNSSTSPPTDALRRRTGEAVVLSAPPLDEAPGAADSSLAALSRAAAAAAVAGGSQSSRPTDTAAASARLASPRLPPAAFSSSNRSGAIAAGAAAGSNTAVVQPSLLRRLLDWSLYLGVSLPGRLLVRWPVRLCCWSVQSLLGLAYTLLYSTSAAPDPARDMEQFLAWWGARYSGVPHPPFSGGSYSQTLSRAKQQLQFMLVYLHCSDHSNTDHFCRKVLSDSRLINYISDNNILFWACDVSLPEGYRVSQALRENDYPSLSLMVLRNSRMSVVARMEGEALLNTQYVLDTLARQHDSSMPHITAARLSRLEREQAVALRQEQDSAYEESLKADREKARKKELEEEQLRQQEEQLKRQEQDQINRKKRMKEFIPEEPPVNSPGALQLVVKLPHGERLERRFHVDQPLSALYCLIYTHQDAPDRFEVTTNFPRKVVPCLPPTDEQLQQQQQHASTEQGQLQQQGSCEQKQLLQPQQQEGPVPNGITDTTPAEHITFGQFGIAPRTVLFVKDLDA